MMRIEQPGTLMPGDGFCNCFILIRTLMFAATHTISPSIFFGTTQASIPGEFYPKSLIIMLIFLMYILISLLIVNRFRLVCCFTYIKKVFFMPSGISCRYSLLILGWGSAPDMVCNQVILLGSPRQQLLWFIPTQLKF